MSTSHWLSLSLTSPVIATSSSATVGQTESLPYIPGSQLRGRVAGRLYRQLGQAADAWIQSPRVRFGDALLVQDDLSEPVPVPLSFHRPKKDGAGAVDAWRNHVVERVPALKQPVQIRGGMLDGAGSETARLVPHFESSERTALKDGMAREGFLYSLHALAAGQRFLARVDIDDDVPAEVRDSILDALDGELRLGRSRGAEFGRVQAHWLTEAPQRVPVATQPLDGDTVPVLALSDWCLFDPATGSPTFQLTPALLGLADDAFTVQTNRCFVRTRAYSPFNAHRRRPDHERQVLVQGSVFTLRLGSCSLAELREAFASGVGEHREDGLGRALVGPAFLQKGQFRPWRESVRSADDGLFQTDLTADPVMQWARARRSEQTRQEMALQAATKFRDQLGRDFYGMPSRSQWGRIRALALGAARQQELVEALKAELEPSEDKRSVRHLEAAWGRSSRGGGLTLAKTLIEWVQGTENGLRAARILAALMVRNSKEDDDA